MGGGRAAAAWKQPIWNILPFYMRATTALLLLAPLVASADDGWSRGGYGRLAFSADYASYAWSYPGSLVLKSYPGSLNNVTAVATSNGTDAALGAFDELALTLGGAAAAANGGGGGGDDDGELAVRYFAATDAFVFLRRPRAAALPAVWPDFTLVGTNASADDATRCVQWEERYFFPGFVLPRTAGTDPQPLDLRQCRCTGGRARDDEDGVVRGTPRTRAVSAAAATRAMRGASRLDERDVTSFTFAP